MRNIKGYAVATDGNSKRIAITFDEVDESGKVTKSNVKVNRVIVDGTVLESLKAVEDYAQTIVDAE